MKMLVNGNVENVVHVGNNIVVVLDDTVEGGQKVISTKDVKKVAKVTTKRVFGRLVTKSNTPKKSKRKRMSKVEMLLSSSPVVTFENTVI